jgi:hypothetical protein
MRKVLLVAKPIVLAAGRYIPLVGTVDAEGLKLVAVANPVVVKFVPSNCNPADWFNVVVPWPYGM